MSEEQDKWIRARLMDIPEKEPTLEHAQRFKDRLEKQNVAPKKKSFSWAVAAVLLPLIGLFSWFALKPTAINPLVIVDNTDSLIRLNAPELAEAEQFFDNTLAAQKKLVAAYALSATDPLHGFLAHLDTLENNYNALRNELIHHGWNSTVEASLIQNYRLRIDIMQRLLEQLELNSKRNNTHHETIENT